MLIDVLVLCVTHVAIIIDAYYSAHTCVTGPDKFRSKRTLNMFFMCFSQNSEARRSTKLPQALPFLQVACGRQSFTIEKELGTCTSRPTGSWEDGRSEGESIHSVFWRGGPCTASSLSSARSTRTAQTNEQTKDHAGKLAICTARASVFTCDLWWTPKANPHASSDLGGWTFAPTSA